MASPDKIERLRERLLVCPICIDEYKDPRLLPCHHTVCFECIGNILRSSSNTGRLFRCPQCRADVFVPRGGIEAFPISFYILSVQDELGSKSYSSSCDICEREWMQSQFKCVDCDLDICRFCIHEHRLCHHDSCRHAIIRIETVPNTVNMSSNRSCTLHTDEILQVYCSTCDKAVCITCSCEEHKLHNTMPMTKKLREAQKQLQTELDRLTTEKKEASCLIDDIHASIEQIKQATTTAILNVEKRAIYLKQSLDNLVDSKQEILQNEERKSLHDLSSFKSELKSYFDQLDNGVHFLEELQEGDMCLELLDGFEKFQMSLSEQKEQIKNKSLKYNQSTFEDGTDFQFFNCIAYTFGNLAVQKKSLSLLDGEDKSASNEKKLNPISVKNVIRFIVASFLFITLGQLILSVIENPENLDIIVISSVSLIYLFMASYFAYCKS